jgi:hypothetical protein
MQSPLNIILLLTGFEDDGACSRSGFAVSDEAHNYFDLTWLSLQVVADFESVNLLT